VPGITNCHPVSANLCRGSQPSAEGMKHRKALGIKRLINLRSLHSAKDELAGTGLKGFHFKTKPWTAETEAVISFLKIVSDTDNLPA